MCVLPQNPSNPHALTLLAVLLLNEAKKGEAGSDSVRQATIEAVGLLKKAKEIDGSHPLVLSQLAEVLYHRKDLRKSLQFAQQALAGTENRELQAFANYCIGRIYHYEVCNCSAGRTFFSTRCHF
jgi:hypothetical protein